MSEDETCVDSYEPYEHENKPASHKFWYGERRVYHNSKKTKSAPAKSELTSTHESDEFMSTDSDWDSHFPALTMKTLNTFTLTSAKGCDKKEVIEASQKSGGDTHFKEEEGGENEVKKIKSREWEKDKYNDTKDDKDGIVFESKTYRDRKSSSNVLSDKKKKVDGDKKESIHKDEEFDDRKRDKYKDTPRESKSKKYSDTRKERVNKTDSVSQKQSMVSKMISSESKTKSLNHDDIKPFTQLPQVKTDDLTKLIEGMEKKTKLEESQAETKSSKDVKDSEESDRKSDSVAIAKVRKSSVDSGEASSKEETEYRRRKSTEERSKSTDREGSEEKDKESAERRAERRIRNKDRPSLVIYQPGMGKFSKQRIGKDKEPTAKSINDSEKKDT